MFRSLFILFHSKRDLRPDNVLLGERGHVLLTFISQWRCVDEEVNDYALKNFYTAPGEYWIIDQSQTCSVPCHPYTDSCYVGL